MEQSNNKNIRNFVIVSHVDHGKSTLADRMLEITKTIEKRKMKEQVLDQMELERERGITIKMTPVTMDYKLQATSYKLNLIDTPGHIDFSYEVSRALKAVEGAILLVDATQGVQAQTLTTLGMARDLGLVIIPVVNKIDSPLARPDDVSNEVSALLQCSKEEVLRCSGKTGEGVSQLLDTIIKKIPPPAQMKDHFLRPSASNLREFAASLRALIFDFQYSDHKGIIVYVRVFEGSVSKRDSLEFAAVGEKFNALEVGIFSPQELPKESLSAGEIGYIVTGIKKPGIAAVGDTIRAVKSSAPALAGYEKPKPVVWASVYPESQDDFEGLKHALQKLQLSDSSFTYEEESSGSLGRGYRCGFLGTLHLEIFTERLRREFNMEIVVTSPSIMYGVERKEQKQETIYSPAQFPDDGSAEKIFEPWAHIKIITPAKYVSAVLHLLFEHEASAGDSETFGDGRMLLNAQIPLRELMRGFFDKLKSATAGFASISYEITGMKEAEVARLDILVAEELVPAFSKVVSRRRVAEEAKQAVEKLHSILPRQLFVTKIQARALGRIISSKTLPALRKDVTGYLYGGDVTRKKKLLEKQKKGKKKMRERGKVSIPQEVFLKMIH